MVSEKSDKFSSLDEQLESSNTSLQLQTSKKLQLNIFREKTMGAPQFGLDNYIGAFNFKVTIDGIEVEKFLSFPFQVLYLLLKQWNLMHGDDRFVMKQPGRSMFEDIVEACLPTSRFILPMA